MKDIFTTHCCWLRLPHEGKSSPDPSPSRTNMRTKLGTMPSLTNSLHPSA